MRYWLFLLVGVFLVLPVLAQVDSTATPDVILLTPTETPTATLTPIWTATLTPESTTTPLPSNTPEATEVIQPAIEVTAEITLELTETLEVTAEASPEIIVIEPVSSPSATLTIAATQPETTVEVTAEITPELTEPVEGTSEVTEAVTLPRATPLATATPGGIALRFVQGIVTYQNRASSAGIEVLVWSDDNMLLSIAITNDSGIYSVPVPVDQAYSLTIDGELHRAEQIQVEVNQIVSPITLAGGDLDDDGCIGQADLDMLIRNYDIMQTTATDINTDGITNLSDLAILTGNYQDCALEQPIVEITPEATVEATLEITVEATAEITPEVTEASNQP